jgi:LmbE family N-acetylglucosaminyl deacetylase
VRSLLFVGAHPDDEVFFAGGTLARYVEEGTRVSIICATRGERGATGDLCSIEELPNIREAELISAMRVLGVTDVHFLPYEDQKLSTAPPDEIRRHLVQLIREIKPQIVITFDPEGANQHTDHMAISRFASDAVSAAADHRWYPEVGPAHQTERLLWQPPTILFRLPEGVDLRREPGIDFLLDVSRWADKKAEAIRAHRTQLPGLGKLFFENPSGRRTFSSEAFRVAWGPRPLAVPADDLFAT